MGSVPHVRPRGEEIAEMDNNPGLKARHWVVEVCHSWFNPFRKLLARYEKMSLGYFGLPMLAASIIVLRKINRKNQGILFMDKLLVLRHLGNAAPASQF